MCTHGTGGAGVCLLDCGLPHVPVLWRHKPRFLFLLLLLLLVVVQALPLVGLLSFLLDLLLFALCLSARAPYLLFLQVLQVAMVREVEVLMLVKHEGDASWLGTAGVLESRGGVQLALGTLEEDRAMLHGDGHSADVRVREDVLIGGEDLLRSRLGFRLRLLLDATRWEVGRGW